MRSISRLVRRAGVGAVASVAGLAFIAVNADAVGPGLNTPTGVLAVENGSSATVTYSESATDSGGGTDATSCSPSSGSSFPNSPPQSISCTWTDSLLGPQSGSVNLNWPVITGTPNPQPVAATGPGGATVTWPAPSATDPFGGTDPVTCQSAGGLGSGSTFPLGNTTVTCSATDRGGDQGQASFTVNVFDPGPTIHNTPGNQIVAATSPNGAVVSWTDPTATDPIDGTDAVTCQSAGGLGNGSTFPFNPHTTVVTCTATDSQGVSATPTTFKVTIFDPGPTIIGTPADQPVNANELGGAVVTWTAPTASDPIDVSDPVNCVGAGGQTSGVAIPPFPVGTTKVTCTSTDSQGKSAAPTSFNVIVTDTSPPVINNTPPNLRLAAANSSGATLTQSALPGGTLPNATDLVDGTALVTCAGPAPGNLTFGNVFPIGTTTVTCTSTDKEGLSAIPTSFTVTVIQATAPVLSFTPPDITVAATGPKGAVVTYKAPTATDPWDQTNPPAVNCSPASGSAFPVGTTMVTCSATDTLNKTSSVSFNVSVQDTSFPVLANIPADITTQAVGPRGAPVSFTSPTATDLIDGTDPVRCKPASGSVFPPGTTTVNCTATDTYGQTSTGTFKVHITDIPSFAATPAGEMVVKIKGAHPIKVVYKPPAATAPVEGKLQVGCTPASGTLFPFGVSSVKCSATSQDGHTITTTLLINVVDKLPPPHVTRLIAQPGKAALSVRWRLPKSLDVQSVVLTRAPGLNGAKSTVLFVGLASSFVDTHVTPGVHYTYTVTSIAPGGRRSTGVVLKAVLSPPGLIAPLDGVTVTAPPLLRWITVAHATYYNVQLYLKGKEVFSAWPHGTHLKLGSGWTYSGRHHALAPGTYTWYVWPGFGPLQAAKYGHLIGQATFIVG